MEKYRIFFRKSAAKELENIPAAHLKKVVSRIESLIENPRPRGCQKLSDVEKYRLRWGPYRIVYTVPDDDRSVIIAKIGHRQEIYRK